MDFHAFMYAPSDAATSSSAAWRALKTLELCAEKVMPRFRS